MEFREYPANEGVHLLGLLRRGNPARADRPNRFLGNDEAAHSSGIAPLQSVAHLPVNHVEGLSRFALLQRLTDAHDRHQPLALCALYLFVDGLVRLTEVPPTLGVPNDGVRATNV